MTTSRPPKMRVEEWRWRPWFWHREFEDPMPLEEPDSGLYMQPEFMDMLERLRRSVGRILIHTAARGGFAAGGHEIGSAHYLGLAADFHCPDSTSSTVARAIRAAGFNGVGFYPEWAPMPGFHVDLADRTAGWTRWKGEYIYL